MNCCVSPLAIDGFAGVTAIDTSVAAVTVNAAAGLVMLPNDAVMLVEPVPAAIANPELPIVATPVAEECQVTVLVKFAVLESV